jgi:xylulokinase
MASIKKVAGVDSSTQSVKIVVRDAATGELISSASRPHPDGTEVDPAHWWQALQELIAEVGGLESLDAIGIAGQQHGMVVLDKNGEVIRPALLWNDTRSSNSAYSLNNEFSDIHTRTGSKLVASFTATKLRWLKDNEPENAKKVAAVALPHDWLSWKLTGSKEINDLFTDRSDASGTGYFNPANNKYDLEILEKALGHANIVLPKVLEPNQFGFDNGKLRISAGAGDNASGAIGVGATVGDLIISLGTSGTAFAVSATPTQDNSGEIAGFADASGNFLPLACTLNAAKVFSATAELLGLTFEKYSELALQAEPGAGGLLFMPHFDGERTPDRPDAKGSIQGITHSNFTPSNIARASIEGVIAGIAYAGFGLEKLGVARKRILLIGGAAKNPAVRKIATEIFGQDIFVPPAGEYVADGAARQAAWALSGEKDLPIWSNSDFEKILMDTSKSAAAEQVRKRYFEALSKM